MVFTFAFPLFRVHFLPIFPFRPFYLLSISDLKHQAMEFFASCASRVMESPAWEEVASAHPELVNDALRIMAKRHATDAGSESPKKKLKFSPCFIP